MILLLTFRTYPVSSPAPVDKNAPIINGPLVERVGVVGYDNSDDRESLFEQESYTDSLQGYP